MADSKGPKSPPPSWPIDPKAQPVSSAPKAPPERASGRVVHDDRGNAVWDWLKETGRFCVESTSAMLKRLDVPGLKMEGDKETDLRLEEESDPGGGYDPYNQKKPVPKSKPPGKK